MLQTSETKHTLRLRELKKALDNFLEFTENITLFQAINKHAQAIAQAVDALEQGLTENMPVNTLIASEAAILLDEIIDVDAISELEAYLLSCTERIENRELTQFLTEVMDKVEHQYNILLKKAQAYNALFIN